MSLLYAQEMYAEVHKYIFRYVGIYTTIQRANLRAFFALCSVLLGFQTII